MKPMPSGPAPRKAVRLLPDWAESDLRRAFSSRLYVYSLIFMHGCLLLHFLAILMQGTESEELWSAPVLVFLFALPATGLGMMRRLWLSGDAELLGLTRMSSWGMVVDAWRVLLLRVAMAAASLLIYLAPVLLNPIPGIPNLALVLAGLTVTAMWSGTMMLALGALPMHWTGSFGRFIRGLLAVMLMMVILLWYWMLSLPRAAQIGNHVMPWNWLFPRFGILHAEGIVPIPGLYISWATVLF
ncbi:MAG: hypothetical protein ACAI35_10330 [Candidatus Methylacidiphilales bacterium]|nr:hypothetical protein [Candidatus Methylacidiphilales bacterium]